MASSYTIDFSLSESERIHFKGELKILTPELKRCSGLSFDNPRGTGAIYKILLLKIRKP